MSESFGSFILLLTLPLLVLGGGVGDECGLASNCTTCALSGNCVWCSTNETGFCASGGMFGFDSGDVKCPTMDWKFRQCSLPGFWVLFISALLIVVVVLVVILVLVVCFKRKERGHSLLGMPKESNKSSAGLGIASLSDEDDTVGSPEIRTDSLKVALSVSEPTEGLAPPLRQIGAWKEYQDDNGAYYYYNEETEESVWEAPPVFKYSDEIEFTPEQENYMKNNTGRYLVRVLYSYTPTNPALWQLTLQEGDLLWVVDSHYEDDWWIGEKCDTAEQGYFAKSFVQVLKRKFKAATKQGEKISSLAQDLRQKGLQ
eukprot:TRINITY_DN207_c0_g1_i3.p1 TRINITY_DN207_c0_g1~~TRINITY_DN207_c0_g1_i3.p1  ORF type:complete len:336 (+),score=69.28 TRINITY_DN207_c0_g1_i3:69-1010(+)